jgi:glycine/D-amino acid oxidase-like deaminating enzyme
MSDAVDSKGQAITEQVDRLLREAGKRLVDLAENKAEDAMVRQESPLLDPLEDEEVEELALAVAALIYRVYSTFTFIVASGSFYSPQTGEINVRNGAQAYAGKLNKLNEVILGNDARLSDLEADDTTDRQIEILARFIVGAYLELANPKPKKKKKRS